MKATKKTTTAKTESPDAKMRAKLAWTAVCEVDSLLRFLLMSDTPLGDDAESSAVVTALLRRIAEVNSVVVSQLDNDVSREIGEIYQVVCGREMPEETSHA